MEIFLSGWKKEKRSIFKSMWKKEEGWTSLNLGERRKKGGKFLNQNERKRDGLNLG